MYQDNTILLTIDDSELVAYVNIVADTKLKCNWN